MNPSAEFSTEALLAHAGWMRALALGLVRDSHAADDVAQDAALAALLHPPPSETALRPWLGQVVRRFAWRRARSERRRSEREAWASEPAGPEDAGETLARLDLQRALLDAVRALEEPVRSTLVQRYFEGRSAAEIAASSGVPASTVRARLSRGLELLRARLDRETGSRAAWMALFAPLVPREIAPVAPGAVTASTPALGALTMTLVKIALAVSAAVVGGLAWWNLSPAAAPVEPLALVPVETPGESDATLALEPERAGDVEGAERSQALAAAPAAAPEPAAPAPAAEAELRGGFDARVVDERGAPWAEAELSVFATSEQGDSPLARGASDSDGRAQVELALPRWARGDAGGAAASFELVVRRAGCVSRHLEVVVRDGGTTHLGEIVLLEAGSVRGRVVDEHGLAVGDARVGAFDAAALEGLDAAALDRMTRVGCELFDELLARPVRTDGGFELNDLAPGRSVVWAHAPGRRFALGAPLEVAARGSVEGIVIVLPELGASERVAGRVVGPDGAGRVASLERVMASSRGSQVDFLHSDMEGRFEFPVEHLDCVYELTAHDGFSEFTPAHVRGVRGGDLEVVIAFARGRSVQVRLSDAQGEAVEGAELMLSSRFTSSHALAQVVEPGVYELQWPEGSNALEVEAAGFRAARTAEYEAAAVPERIELVLQRAPLVRGVVSADGRPLAGAKVESLPYDPDGSMTVNGLRCSVIPFENGSCTSDAEGRFELYVDGDRPIVVRASAANWVDVESEPFEVAGDAEPLALALGRGGVIEGRVLVPAGESAAGRVVGAHRGDGRPRSLRTAEDGTFRFEGLMPGDWHVFPLQEEYAPHEASYASTSTTEPLPWSCRVDEGRTTHFDLDLAGG